MPAIITGTKTFFKQTNAPSGWTKSVTDDNYTLRVVSGGTGGTLTAGTDVTTRMVDTTFPGTVSAFSVTLPGVMADLPAHTHTYTGYSGSPNSVQAYPGSYTATTTMVYYNATVNGNPGGTGATHTHTLVANLATETFNSPANFAVKYVDLILATKA